MQNSATPSSLPSVGVAWLLTDQILVAAMTVLVKKGGAEFPAVQMVFLRSLIGLLCVLPLIWRERAALRDTQHLGRHLFRIFCNAAALSCNWMALTALPLATANALSFVRPLVVMVMAALLLDERITRWRWASGIIGLLGVLIIIGPQVRFGGDWGGYLASAGMTIFGALAVIQTRALAGENTIVLMVFYTVGLTVLTAIPAFLVWQPVGFGQWPMLLSIGVLAQIGQYCFLRAYQSAPANRLAGIGYVSIIFATIAGFVFFDEIPRWTTYLGVSVIFGALFVAHRYDRA